MIVKVIEMKARLNGLQGLQAMIVEEVVIVRLYRRKGLRLR
jgi:hypothetical protein